MSAEQQPLSQWVRELNDSLFIQPDDEIALKTLDEQVDRSLVVRYVTLFRSILTSV